MSYSYDVMERVFEERIRPHIDDVLGVLFADLIQDMHNANHRVPSADGVFKGDGINKDGAVTRAARALDEWAKDHPEEER